MYEAINIWSSFSRFESLEPEMNNQASRVAVVNQIARQLMHNGHPSEKDIKAQQDKLNNRQVAIESKASVWPLLFHTIQFVYDTDCKIVDIQAYSR